MDEMIKIHHNMYILNYSYKQKTQSLLENANVFEGQSGPICLKARARVTSYLHLIKNHERRNLINTVLLTYANSHKSLLRMFRTTDIFQHQT